MNTEFQARRYLSLPRMSVDDVLHLAQALHAALPPGSSEAVQHAGAQVVRRAETIDALLIARDGSPAPELREAVRAVRTPLTSMRDALRTLASYPPGTSPDTPSAAELVQLLFPRSFGRSSAKALWGYAHRVATHLAVDPAIGADVARLVGRPLVDLLLEKQTALGVAVAIYRPHGTTPDRGAVRDAMRAFREDLMAYVRALLSALDTSDEATVQGFFDAVAPITTLREQHASSPGTHASPPSPIAVAPAATTTTHGDAAPAATVTH